jgi:hypothetical protein
MAALVITFADVVPNQNQVCAAPPAAVSESGSATDVGHLPIPKQSDWNDYGVVLPSGMTGAWDDGLGMAPAMSSVITKDGQFFLYYVGFDGVRASDEGERNRSIGVATSSDGVRFHKYPDNPIITYRPNNNEEETAGGMAAAVDENNNVVLYWGAADAGSPVSTRVDSDIRLSTSRDGFNVIDRGDVIRHNDPSVWGYGDELYPLGVIQNGTTWHLYYIAKGLRGIVWDVGIASGPTPEELTHTRCALAKGDGPNIFGGGSIVELGPDTYALFLVRNNAAPYIEARTFSLQSPHQLSRTVETYNFEDFWEGAVFLDKERKTWFMYYLDGSSSDDYFEWPIKLKLAPVGERDKTPSSAPAALVALANVSGVHLAWNAAQDADTGVVSYNIYRDGKTVGTTLNLQYHDTDEIASPDATYQVSAVNFHDVEGPLSEPITVEMHNDLVFVPVIRR